MRNLFEWIKINPTLTILIVLLILIAAYLSAASVSQRWDEWKANRKNAEIQKQINKSAKNGEASEANANRIRDDRQPSEARVVVANEQREQARVRSHRTVEPLRKARQRHDQVRQSNPRDYPSISDDELCAELAKRSIACR